MLEEHEDTYLGVLELGLSFSFRTCIARQNPMESAWGPFLTGKALTRALTGDLHVALSSR